MEDDRSDEYKAALKQIEEVYMGWLEGILTGNSDPVEALIAMNDIAVLALREDSQASPWLWKGRRACKD